MLFIPLNCPPLEEVPRKGRRWIEISIMFYNHYEILYYSFLTIHTRRLRRHPLQRGTDYLTLYPFSTLSLGLLFLLNCEDI